MGAPEHLVPGPHPGPSAGTTRVPALGRRAMLAGVLGGGALLTACRGGPAPAPDASSAPSSAPSSVTGSPSGTLSGDPTGSAATAESGDRTRVRRALDATQAMLTGVLALRQTPVTRGLASLHTAHRTMLLGLLDEGEVSASPSAGPVPLTRDELPLREAGLQAELVAAALAAEDGRVARVLASMSAGVAQQLAALPTDSSAGPVPDVDSPPSGAQA